MTIQLNKLVLSFCKTENYWPRGLQKCNAAALQRNQIPQMIKVQMSDCSEDDFQPSDSANDSLKIRSNDQVSYRWLDSYTSVSPYSKSQYSYSQKPNLSLQYKIEKLTDELDTKDLQLLISKLKLKFEQRLRKQPQQKIRFNKQSQSIEEEGKYQTSTKAIISYPTISPPQFSNYQQKQYYECKQLIAFQFIGKHYNYDKLKQKLIESASKIFVHQNGLNYILYEIVLQSYHVAYQFMHEQLKYKTMQMTKQDEIQLESLLVDCRQNLTEAVCNTFFKFVEMAFNLRKEVSLSNREVLNFNNSLQQWIFAFRLAKQTKQSKEHHCSDNTGHNQRVRKISKPVVSLGSSIVRTKAEKSILKQQHYNRTDRQQFRAFISQRVVEIEMLSQYKLNPTVSHITAYLKHKYPQKGNCIVLVEVKTKFHMILRAAYRRLVQLWNMLDCNTKMPRLIPLNNRDIQLVLVSPQTLKVRIGLINVWLLEQRDTHEKIKNAVSPAVIQISDYIYGRQYPELKDLKSEKHILKKYEANKVKTISNSKCSKGINHAMLSQETAQK